METDVQLLEQQLSAVKTEIADLNQRASRAIKGVGGKDEAKLDLFRYRQLKQKLQNQLPIIQSKILQAQLKQLSIEREQARQSLKDLQDSMLAAKVEYDEQLKVLEEKWNAHAVLQAKAFSLDQVVVQTYESIQIKRRELRKLVKDVTGLDDEEQVRPDGLPNTGNLLIRK